MRYFPHFPENTICPVCNSNVDKECTMIPIDGTDEGNNCEASVIHKECTIKALEGLRHNKEADILYYSLPQE